MDSEATRNPEFVTTRWTLIDRVRSGDLQDRTDALDTLVRIYRIPLTRHLQRSGHQTDAAEDLVQSFTADVIIGRRLLEKADPARGRLRSLLLTSLRRYAVDTFRRRPVELRPGPPVSLDGNAEEAPDGGEDLGLFDRDWAGSVLDEALRRTEAHYLRSGRAAQWALFDRWIVRPSLSNTSPPSLTSLAVEVGVTVNAAAAIQTARESVRRAFRELLAEQGLHSPEDTIWAESLLQKT